MLHRRQGDRHRLEVKVMGGADAKPRTNDSIAAANANMATSVFTKRQSQSNWMTCHSLTSMTADFWMFDLQNRLMVASMYTDEREGSGSKK